MSMLRQRTSPKRRAIRWGVITPGLVAFIASSRIRGDPYGLYRVWRRIDPVHASPIGVWLLATHTDVATALRDPRLGSDESKVDPSSLKLGFFERFLGRDGHRQTDSPFRDVFANVMLFRDPPDHTRLRALVTKTFTPRRIETLERRIAELVEEILEGVSAHGRMDVMRDLAYPLPARIICELIGVPADDQALFVRHAPTLAIGFDPEPMRSPEAVAAADLAISELIKYLTDLISRRRHQPGDDLLSALIAAEQDDDRLSHEELISTIFLLIMAGHETTANLVGNGLLALLRNPSELARFRDDPTLDQGAIEELLRYDSPVQMVQRITLEPVELGGEVIPAGRIVIPVVGAANRDPSVFEHPDRLDIGRSPNAHLAFGGGMHFCIGAPLARLEGRIILGSLVRRFPSLRLVDGGIARRPTFVIRGLTKLEVTWR